MIAVRMPRRSKYGARPVVIDGIRFASTREGKRYAELKLLAKAGEITCLQLQPKYEVYAGDVKLFTYIGDFQYYTFKGGRDGLGTVIEDVKGVRTPVYRLKKKIVEAVYNLEIVEV